MRLQSHFSWILALTLASQLGASQPAAPTAVLPELIATRQALFAIPFRLERPSDPAWQPVEAQLYVSTDRGAHWRLYTKAPTAQKHFTFRSGGDGEFWFAICTADRSGQTRPKTIESPGLRVLVDTKPPALKIVAQPGNDGQVSVRWEISEANLKPNSLNIVYRPSPTEPWRAVAIDPRSQESAESLERGEVTFVPKAGASVISIRAQVSDVAGNPAVANAQVKLDEPPAPRPSESSIVGRRASKPAGDGGPSLLAASSEAVTVAGKPAIGRKYTGPGDSPNNVPGMPPGERPRMVNSRSFELEYEVDSVGPSGIGRVELWGTSDAGQTWRRFTSVSDKRSSLRVNVPEEGIYGFRVVVTNGSGIGGKPPVAGDQPDLWICVDLTKPTARIVSAQQGVESEAGQLIISWQADDKMLAARPITLSFSQSRGGPWTPIAAGLENTGRYAWPIDNRTPPKLFLRLEVRDEAGNLAVHEMTEPVAVDQSHPKVRIRSVRPVSQPK
jgi:hypothetical protein